MDHERRLAAYALVLRELVHRALARVVTEPWLHDKRTLARHAHDDAQSVAELLDRLSRPTPTVAVIGEREVYADVKPGLAAAVREHLEVLDLSRHRDDAELLERVASRQELHVMELPARHAEGASPLALPEDGPPLRVQDAPEMPERDPFVEPGSGGDGVHAQLNASIIAAEIAARTSHERIDAPWAFHLDLIRLAVDRLAATHALDRALAAEGLRWGDRPVALGGWASVLELDVGGRLAFAADAGDPAHAAVVARWGG